MIYRFIFLFLIIISYTFSSADKPLVIGLLNNPFYNLNYSNISSFNDEMKKFFLETLQLKVEFQAISYKNLKTALDNNTIDGVALIPKNSILNNNLIFSDVLYSENLFVVSTNEKFSSFKELDNKTVYVPYLDVYQQLFSSIVDNNDLNTKLVPVENLSTYKDKFILTSNPSIYKPEYGINVSKSTGISIALNKEHKELIPIINKAFNDGFRDFIHDKINRTNKNISINNFYKSLTNDEKNYLNSRSTIKISYDNNNNDIGSYKSEIDNQFKGIAPNIIKKISENLNIKFINTNDYENSDILVLSKTQQRLEKYIFSQKIYDLGIYFVSLEHRSNKILNKIIGVLENTIEEGIAKRYYTSDHLKIFKTSKEMITDLNKGVINGILITNKDIFDINKYDITFFESAPINFTFKKDDVILKNIINKALRYLVNIPKSVEEAAIERDLESKLLYKKNKETKNVLISVSTFITLILGVISIYLCREKLHKRKLLKDSLTGLSNRFVFDEFCKTSNHLTGYTFVLDLNNFKKINDFLGHDVGDLVLKEFGDFLKNSFQNDYIFRISGDEFYGFSFQEPNTIIDKLKTFKEFCPTLNKHNISFNIGICYKKSSTSLTSTFRYADLAMLDTKKRKSTFYKVTDEEFLEKIKRENFILQLFKKNKKDIFAMFQPKYCLKSKKIIGAEALARFKVYSKNTIAPQEFIPIAEKHDFIHKIDYKIAEEATCFVKELLESNVDLTNFRISFNLSINTFKRDDLVVTISNFLKEFNVSGDYLEIEITESIFILDMKNLITKLKELKKLGIKISLDDFTAGHSTAGLLPLLPIDIVKFDRSLLNSRNTHKTKAEIVFKNLTSLIKDLNFKIVAEGIEHEEEVNFLKSLNIDYVQGFYFNKPLYKASFIEEMKK